MTNEPSKQGIAARLTSHLPQAQFVRYLLVGAWNTAFGYGVFVLITHLLAFMPNMYLRTMLASVLSNAVAITVAFLGYKWFVFKTKGHYLREWLRCMAVYGGNMLLGLALLPAILFVLRHGLGVQHSAPYLAGLVLTAITVVVSFFGHKHISFRQPGDTTPLN